MTQGFETVTIGKNAVQIANANTGPILITNKSFTNSIFLSYQQSVDTTNASSASEVPPMGSVELNPQSTIWAACAGNLTAPLQIMPEGSGYSPSPVEIATQILNSGVILVDQSNTLTSQSAFVIGAGATVGTLVFDVRTYQSWLFDWVPNVLGAGGTNPYIRATFQWWADAAGTILVFQEDWILPATATNWPTISGHGLMHGPYMSISFTSYDSVADTIAFNLIGSTRNAPSASTLRSNGAAASGGFGTDDVLGFLANNSLAAGLSTTEQPINYYNGRVLLKLRASGTSIAANTLLFHLKTQPITDFGSVDNSALGFPTVANGTSSPDALYEFLLPKRPCTFTVQNTGSVTISLRVLIVAEGGKP